MAAATAATAPPPGAEVRAPTSSRKPVRVFSSISALKEADRAAAFVDVDVEGRRLDAEPRHRLHVAEKRYEPARPRVRTDIPHGDGESGRRIQERWVVGQRQVRLCHADGKSVESVLCEALDLLLR